MKRTHIITVIINVGTEDEQRNTQLLADIENTLGIAAETGFELNNLIRYSETEWSITYSTSFEIEHIADTRDVLESRIIYIILQIYRVLDLSEYQMRYYSVNLDTHPNG